jgi:hypothetical protein
MQARWRLVSAPQIPNLLSLDPTTDPFKSLSNLNLGYEIEVQLGKKVRVRPLCHMLSLLGATAVFMELLQLH